MIDLDGLEAVYLAGQREPDLFMGMWEAPTSECGTAHCLIGAFCTQNEDSLHLHPIDRIPTYKNSDYERAISARFGITEHETRWLFMNLRRWKFANNWMSAQWLDKERALARLRKFIDYKRAKQSLVTTHGRNNYIVDRGRFQAGVSA